MPAKLEKCRRYSLNAILGVQHLFAMMGSNILVPIITGLRPSISLVSAGIGTTCFHFLAKRKVPVFLGSSFSFVSAMLAIADLGAKRGWTHDEVIGRQMVGVIMSGILYFLFALIAFLAGAERVKKLFPPVVVGPIIVVIGMTLAPTVIKSNIVDQYTPDATGHANMKDYEAWTIALVTALVIVIVAIFAKGIFKVFPVLFGIVAGYIVSAAFQVIDYSKITDEYWILFQPEAFKQTFGFYKHLGWDWSVVLMIAPISIVTFMEHLGDITTNGAVCGQNFMADPGLHCTLFGDGVAVCIAGFLGGPPVTTYGENTGVLALTKNYNPKVILIAAIYSLCLGIISKFGGILASVPGPVIGGASMIMFGMIASMGLKVLVDNNVDFSLTKNMMITALILVIGLGFSGGGVNAHIKDVQISPLAIATVAGIILNLILPARQTLLSRNDTKDGDQVDSEDKGLDQPIDELDSSVQNTSEKSHSESNTSTSDVEVITEMKEPIDEVVTSESSSESVEEV